MKAVKITLAGRERYLTFTVETMFAINEIFGGFGELIKVIWDTRRDGFSAACNAAALQLAIPSVLSLGYGREIELENGEIDLGLAELGRAKKFGNAPALYPHGDACRVVKKRNVAVNTGGDRRLMGTLHAGARDETARAGRRIKQEGRR